MRVSRSTLLTVLDQRSRLVNILLVRPDSVVFFVYKYGGITFYLRTHEIVPNQKLCKLRQVFFKKWAIKCSGFA